MFYVPSATSTSANDLLLLYQLYIYLFSVAVPGGGNISFISKHVTILKLGLWPPPSPFGPNTLTPPVSQNAGSATEYPV